jgi:hypothetical protein
MAKPNETYTVEEQERSDAVDRYRRAFAPPKSAKVLVDQESSCENGLEDTTIPRKAVRRSGLGTNPEHRKMFTERRIRGWNNS